MFSFISDADVFLPMDVIENGILVGSLNGLVINGAQISNETVFGHSLSLAGTRRYINLGNQGHTCLGSLHLCSDGITVAFWVKPESHGLAQQFLMDSGGNTPNSQGITASVQDAAMIRVVLKRLFNNTMGKRYWLKSDIIMHKWSHIAVTMKPEDLAILYLDGCLQV